MRDAAKACSQLLVVALLASLSRDAHATTVYLRRSAISASSGRMSGGATRLGYTLGEVGVGRSTGGSWIDVAGFWHGNAPATVQVPPPLTLPVAFSLERAVPSPFSSTTTLRFAVPSGGDATPMTIRLFDVSGRVVRVLERGARTPGVHAVIWDGRDDRGGSVANGVYFCLMQAGPFRATRRLVLIH